MPSPHPDSEHLAALGVPGAVPGWDLEYLAETGSTNAVAAAGARDRRVVVTDHQQAGRGRLGRSWQTPAGVALTVSVVVDPRLSDSRWPWLPLITGLAVADAIAEVAPAVAGVELKWPNDVLIDGAKVAGILLERVPGPLAVLGVGINVHQRELPVPTATSLALAGADCDRGDLLLALLVAVDGWLVRLAEDPEGVRQEYVRRCASLRRDLTVHLPGESRFDGRGVDIDDSGRLVVRSASQELVVSAGDVVHLR